MSAWAAHVHGWLLMHHFGTVFLGFTETPNLTVEASFFSDGLGDFSSCAVACALGGRCLYCLFLFFTVINKGMFCTNETVT